MLVVLLAGVGYRKFLTMRANSLVVSFTLDRRGESERFAPKFLADKLAWKRIDLFNPASPPALSSRDAGEWLNSRLTWLPAGTARGSGSAPKSEMLKGFSSAIRDQVAFAAGAAKLGGWQDDWASHSAELFPPGRVPFLDFTWIRGLEGYSYWDIDAASPVKAALSLNTKLLGDDLPEPSWGEVETWAELRLLHGIAMRDLAPALRDSRTLIRLLLATERWNALETAIRLLRKEEQALRVYTARVNPKFSGSTMPLQPETIAALERYLRAFPAMLDTATDPETLTDAFLADGQIFGLCAELNRLAARIFRDRLLLSDAYSYGVETIGRIVKDPGNRCRVPRLKALWDNPTYLPPPLAASGWSPASIPELPGFLEVSSLFDLRIRPSEDAALANLPAALRGSSAVRRAVGIALKRADPPPDPWAGYARQK